MVLRIILDLVKRKWALIAFAVFQLSIICKAAWYFWPTADPWAGPLALAWYLTIPPGPMLQGRPFYQLPVSRRTLWLARWWLSTAGATVIATLGSVAARLQAGTPQDSIERMTLFVTFAFLWTGFGMALLAAGVGAKFDQPVDMQQKVMKTILGVAGMLVVATVLTLGLPFVFARFLPHTFGEIGARSGLAMIAMLGVTVFGFLHDPAVVARPSRAEIRRQQDARSTSSTDRPRFADRMTGLRLALWDEARWQLMTFAAAAALLIAGWSVGWLLGKAAALPVFLRDVSALPFSTRTPQATEGLTWLVLFFAVHVMDAVRTTGIRSLRTLPLSTARLSSLPVAAAVISTSMLWVTLLVIHVLTLATLPVTLRPDLFLAFAALTAIVHTIWLVTPGPVFTKGVLTFIPVTILLVSMLFVDSWQAARLQSVMLVGGLAGLGASFAVMRFSITRSSRMYRPAAIVARF